ncbi:alpha-galactosidase [Agrobacterium rubi]|uniref:Alpha-galactosidase n=1 Tax=Agrobacterium rubi TaxID=28099 RepID=A0AAE7UTH5_9HYPH|nr:alpha-galactosidase [Agrobacterium rubi]NTE88952.1 alpha-galactosidase [Agrobacterium rubi]NTF04780.1 alpha-galactosidase [Agrobacterium rubi]NTF39341.1 alpha-galactosidase [Agrobacterium rubi]OCJ51175.1 alpha-galactosidase [Agrobacterium rubi]QTG02980.1 alpha-galactosidase [Agrobacterium rubi]
MSQIITIGKGNFTLNLRLPELGMPEILSFATPATSVDPLFDIERSSRVNGMDVAVPSSVLLPTGGMGFFGWPAISGHRQGRDFTLQFEAWEVQTAGNATTLHGHDAVAKIDLSIALTEHASGLISMSTALTNRGEAGYQLDRCMAATFASPAGETELTNFTGMWGREFQTRKETLGNGIWSQESRRGRTSHDRFPMIFVETAGQRFGVTLGWSGNHHVVIDRADDGQRLIHMGELFEPGEVILGTGETYQSPVACAGPDTEAFHAFVRGELLDWPDGKMSPRPVTLNTWEGNYFDHKMDSLKAQATAAAKIGIERFVLDDGWFGKRDDDTTSLGDWDIDARKYPEGLKPLVDHATGLGMQFGIWFEPEMINPVSELYQKHPDWALQIDGRPLLQSRTQLVLDLTRKEVSDYLFSKIDAVLANHSISYIKWDMNRDLTHAGGRDGRVKTSAQTRAVYALMDRVRAAHPTVEIESCASGGGRIDFGVLARTHRVWTSDCTDALERLEIQRGASLFVPPEILGSHISASPNHQTGRRHTLAFRALVAMAYHLGVELNPLELTADESDELKLYIETYKRLRSVLHAPGANFCMEPVDGRYVWGAATAEKIVVIIAQGAQMVGEQPAPLKLPESVTKLGGTWTITNTLPAKPEFIRISEGQKKLLSGNISFELSSVGLAGLPLPMLKPESALLLELEPAKGGKTNG